MGAAPLTIYYEGASKLPAGRRRGSAAGPQIEDRDVDLARLPPQLRLLVRSLGLHAAFRLVKAYGGTPVKVPRRVRPNHVEHPLYLVLGADAFAKLVDAYGDEVLHLPKYDSIARQARHDLVRQLRRGGATRREIALSTGYTTRHVGNILGDAPPPPQGDLFDGWGDESA